MSNNSKNNGTLADSWQKTVSTGHISLDEAKKAIIASLREFDTNLGQRAENILNDPKRTNIHIDRPNSSNMQACRMASITHADLKKMGMYDPDHAKKHGPEFAEQKNDEKYSIIDLDYDGSPASVVYLAHELGHAIAGDVQRESGRNFRNFFSNELEQQAYFVQNIFTHYTGQGSPETNTLQGLSEESPLQVSWDRAMQYAQAENDFDTARSMSPTQRNTRIIAALGGMIDIEVTTENNMKASGLKMD